MPFIRNVRTDQQVISLFSNTISLQFNETSRLSAANFAASEVQTKIAAGELKEVPGYEALENIIKDTWDMEASTALPAGAQPGDMYDIVGLPAVHPTSGDAFEPGDIAIIAGDGILVRNVTKGILPGGSGGAGQYNWIAVNSAHNASENEYILADSLLGSFNIVLPAIPDLGDTIGVYPSTSSFPAFPVTVLRNGNAIQGIADDVLFNENLGATFIFVGGAVGWLLLPLDDTVVFIQDLNAASHYTIVEIVGTSHLLTAADSGKVLVFDEAGACTITMPEYTTQILQAGFYASIRNRGGGVITFVNEGTDILEGSGDTTNDSTKLSSVYLEVPGTPNTWVSMGDLFFV